MAQIKKKITSNWNYSSGIELGATYEDNDPLSS